MIEIVEKQEPSLLDKKINIATASNKFAIKWKNQQISIRDFVKKIGTPTVKPESVAEFHSLPKSQQDDIKDNGGYVGGLLKGGRRNASSIAHRSIVTLDLDHADVSADEILAKTESALSGHSWIAHSTHKHTPEHPRMRILCFLDRPVFPDEYQAISRKLAEKINIEWFDDSTYQAHRLMYWPSMCQDGEWVFMDRTTTDFDDEALPFLSADEMLNSYGEEDAWKDTSLWPTSSRQSDVITRGIKKQEDPVTKKGVVGAFCRVYDIHSAIKEHLSSVYKRSGKDRYTYIDGSSEKGLAIYENKFAYSNHATDPASNILCNAFDLVRIHKFGHLDEATKEGTSGSKLPSYRSMVEWASDIEAVKIDMVKNKINDTVNVLDDFEVITEDKVDGKDEHGEGWLETLQTTREGAVKPTFGNVCDILAHDESLKDLVWYNELSNSKEYGKKGGREWRNEDALNMRKYLRNKYDIDISSMVAGDAVDWRADKKKHHPVKEYLQSILGSWDGIKRVETFWIKYIGEKDDAYTRETAKCFFLAAVTRVIEPGYKFDYVPVIYGAQGIGKSTLCATLCGKREWFGELNTYDDQQAVEQMNGHWIMEIAELSASNRSEIEQQKAFISATKNCVRLAYRRDPATYQRQCVFIGSTNQREYLKDTTGNRRWWPIDCGEEYDDGLKRFDIERLKGEVDQLWAEAMEMYCDPDATTELSQEAYLLARERQESKLQSDEWKGVIESFLESKADKQRYSADWDEVIGAFDGGDMEDRERVCIAEIWQDCLKMKQPMRKYDGNRIASIIDAIDGWERKQTIRFGDRFGRQRGWINKKSYVPF
ncbi:MAG: virulence-associated E family protein [Prevotella sp.]